MSYERILSFHPNYNKHKLVLASTVTFNGILRLWNSDAYEGVFFERDATFEGLNKTSAFIVIQHNVKMDAHYL